MMSGLVWLVEGFGGLDEDGERIRTSENEHRQGPFLLETGDPSRM